MLPSAVNRETRIRFVFTGGGRENQLRVDDVGPEDVIGVVALDKVDNMKRSNSRLVSARGGKKLSQAKASEIFSLLPFGWAQILVQVASAFKCLNSNKELNLYQLEMVSVSTTSSKLFWMSKC